MGGVSCNLRWAVNLTCQCFLEIQRNSWAEHPRCLWGKASHELKGRGNRLEHSALQWHLTVKPDSDALMLRTGQNPQSRTSNQYQHKDKTASTENCLLLLVLLFFLSPLIYFFDWAEFFFLISRTSMFFMNKSLIWQILSLLQDTKYHLDFCFFLNLQIIVVSLN